MQLRKVSIGILILIGGIIHEDYQKGDGNIDGDVYPQLPGSQGAVAITLYYGITHRRLFLSG